VPLVVAAAQPACVSFDVPANVAAHAELVRAARARVVVFPELSLTGYELEAPVLSPDDAVLQPLLAACGETGSVALVGAPVGEEERAHIGVLAVSGAGAAVVYRKVWLGAAETARFTPGEAPAVLAVDGWRLGLAVCRDMGIAQHAADTAALGMDAYLAGTLEHVEDGEVQVARARRVAEAHGVWVVVASFAGSTGGGYGDAVGCSAIWAPDGSVLAGAGPEEGAVVRATLG